MKKRSVFYAPEALQDLIELYDRIAVRAAAAVAVGYVGRIEAFCAGLSFASERGQRRDDIRPGLRIIGFERRVTVAFSVGERSVTILRVFYGGVDWEAKLSE
jgi:toxin ParE1/3/4